MWRSHLRLALRPLRRDRGYALLNGVGLAVAFTCCILIALFARDELTFDRFHDRADQLVILGVEDQWFGQDLSSSVTVPYPLHQALEAEVPAVERAVLTSQGAWPMNTTRSDGTPVGETDVLLASPGFFEAFSFPLANGDPATALAAPGNAVIAESAAERLFGDRDPVGQTITVEQWGEEITLTLAGVALDPPKTSTVQFELVASTLTLPEDQRSLDSWGSRMWRTHARLAPGATVADLDRQLGGVVKTHFAESEQQPRYFGVPLTDFYLSSLHTGGDGFRGNSAYLGLFGAAALFILLLGGINYVNLATARATRRAREVGVRKALGAGRWSIAAQFLTESVVLAGLAAAVAFGLAALLLSPFNSAFGSELALTDLDAPFALVAVGVVVGVGLLAGAYPALVLSGFSPSRVLRGALSASGRPSGTGLRRALVVTQFVVAIGLLAGTSVVLRQIAFTAESDLGFEQDGLVWLPLTEGISFGGSAGPTGWRAGRDAALAVPGVVAAVGADMTPGNMGFGYGSNADPSRPDESFSYSVVAAEPGYVDVLGADLVAGTDLDGDRPTVLLNESTVRLLGWTPEEAVGRTFRVQDDMTVAGVVGDYTFESMRSEIGPVAIFTAPGSEADSAQYQGLLVRFADGQAGSVLDGLEAAWTRVRPDEAFNPVFVDESLAKLYDADRRLSRVLGGFALVAVLVACLGLVGLAAYSAERRSKEIGIRRVLGATVRQIVTLLTREYAVLVAIGAAVAVPLTVLGVQRWLDGFVYRTVLSPGLFVGVVALTLALALTVVGAQALRAARRNPTRTLRTD